MVSNTHVLFNNIKTLYFSVTGYLTEFERLNIIVITKCTQVSLTNLNEKLFSINLDRSLGLTVQASNSMSGIQDSTRSGP